MAFDVSSIFAAQVAEKKKDNGPQLIRVDIDLLETNEANFYAVDETKLEELKNSIALSGVMDPPTVCETGTGMYRLISGHRRTAAVRALVEEGREDLRQMPVFVRSPKSAAMEELELIMANSTARVLTSAEISQAAQRVERLLYDLKEQGVEFPGRMRDHVAEACNVSRTKLANLHTIESGLLCDFHADWAAGKIPDSTALELARMKPEDQQRLRSALGSSKEFPTAKQIERVREAFESGHTFQPSCTCPDGSHCSSSRGNAMLRAAAFASPYGDSCTGDVSCMECKLGPKAQQWNRCSQMCSKAKETVKEANAEIRETKEQRDKARRDEYKDKAQALAARFAIAANLAGCSGEFFVIDRYTYTLEDLEQMAAGDFDGVYLYCSTLNPTYQEIPALCRTLKCSADYLCGLTDTIGG